MRYITRFDPFLEFQRMLQAHNFDEFVEGTEKSSLLPLDIKDEEDQLVLETDLPGFNSEDVEITATSDSLTIKAEKKFEEKEENQKNYVRRERHFHSSVARSVNLPAQIEPEQVEASFRDGLLIVMMPKAISIKPKKVSVKPE